MSEQSSVQTPAQTSEKVPLGGSRRDFLKFCGVIAATLGLEASWVPKIAEALTAGQRPPVIWLHFAECTGCSESFLRSSNPSVETILLDTISLDYHETLMVAAGEKAEANRDTIANQFAGEFICIVEGAIPTATVGGIPGGYGMIGNKTMLAIAQDILPKAKYVISYGTCAAYGGLPAANPNPTGAKGVSALGLTLRNPVINIPGCPANNVNLVSCLTSYLLNGTMPALDSKGRPTFAYGSTVHSRCVNLAAPDKYGCLLGYRCKGTTTYNNCPSVKFNDGESWCVKVEHPCIGCAEPNFWDVNAPFYDANFAGLFANYRGKAGGTHPVNPTASCTGSGCHSSSTYASRKSGRTAYAFQSGEHNRSDHRGRSCTTCHTVK